MEARVSEHNEAYQPMGRLDGIRIGVGAKFPPPDETTFFMEVVIHLNTGPGPDLKELERNLETMRGLEATGFSLNIQDDGGFICEFVNQRDGLEEAYDQVTLLFGKQ